ncbi:arylsulfatase [Paraflavitalea sp. CAU 1676]|uniref:arylsulfatase n=1 Tax=Paraflavitalea sp. CAU 1676 TaxID=3032598 RepID=UPI0023DC1998|nr:arylsulfatase [Paraflavitalea sp. CAU 1676]MDF2193675.1 arylsulfatase [Paraflavitalea sp. CAU 1676]
MKNIALTLFLFPSLLQVVAALAQQKAGPSRQPTNIILIVADDLGYGDLGCYGQKKFTTPNIDKLAATGMQFTQFYSGTTVCAPSRASLMTGLHTGHTAIRGNRGFKPEGQFPLPDSALTIAAVLKKAGYATGAFGKWGMGYPGSSGEPLKQGIQRFYGYNCQSQAHNYFPDHLWDNDRRVEFPGNITSDSLYSPDKIHSEAMKFLQENSRKPFFLFLPYTLPHAKLELPHDDSVYNHYVKAYDDIPTPPGAPSKGVIKGVYPHAAFAAMVSRLDRYVGEVYRYVQQNGLAENTLIIFTSDNGPHREDHGDPEFFNSNGGLRGIKRDMYEGGIRVPFIASWKGKIKAGVKNEQPAAWWDLFPTFQELANIMVWKQIDGISIIPALTGKPQRAHNYFYWEFHEQGGKQAVRWGKWKGVRLNVSKEADGPMELYDLAADPAEKNNIAAAHPEIVKQIAAYMQEAHVPDAQWPLLAGENKANSSVGLER